MKKTAKWILGIMLLLFVGSLFISNKFNSEQSIWVNAPVKIVFEQANTLKNWEKWSPWAKMDPTMTVVYNEIPSGKGAAFSWIGENPNVGKGSMTITNSIPEGLIAYYMSFDGAGEGTSTHRFENAGDSVKVIWSFESDLGYNPIAKYMTKIMSGMMEETFMNGLKNFKTTAEQEAISLAPSDKIEIEEKALNTPIYFLAIKTKATASTVSQELGKCYGMIVEEIKKQALNISTSAAPFATYYAFNNANFEFDAAIPTDKPGKSNGTIFSGQLPAGKYLVAHYYGAYEFTSLGHDAVKLYGAQKNLTFKGAPSEMYLTDPMTEKDTAKWLTDIYYSLQDN